MGETNLILRRAKLARSWLRCLACLVACKLFLLGIDVIDGITSRNDRNDIMPNIIVTNVKPSYITNVIDFNIYILYLWPALLLPRIIYATLIIALYFQELKSFRTTSPKLEANYKF